MEDGMSLKEYGKKCQLCGKKAEAHMYPQKIDGKWLRICKACWELNPAQSDK